MPICPLLIAESFNKMLLACLDICLETEQEQRQIKNDELRIKNVLEK